MQRATPGRGGIASVVHPESHPPAGGLRPVRVMTGWEHSSHEVAASGRVLANGFLTVVEPGRIL